MLCGSKRYPIRDPFFSMLKRSLQNFMNAFTSADWTMYPFATTNQQDFFNLLNVYLDAAFFPLLKEQSFFQEGWRLDLSEKTQQAGKLVAKGVVFNEMKGAMSTQSEIMVRRIQQALYPTVTYHHNSGGEPADIIDLDWEQLKKFHKEHYNPSNAWFYLYGDLELDAVLDTISARVLDHFDASSALEVKDEQRFSALQRFCFTYPTPDNSADACQIAVSWLLDKVYELDELLVLRVLASVLLGSSGAPLQKALIESKLGTSLCDGAGFESSVRETFFVAGLKGVKPENLKAVENLITDTLEKLVKNGIPQDLVSSALHQFELQLRQLDEGGYPQGLRLLLGLVDNWIHGGDPLASVDFDHQIKKLSQTLKKPRFLEQLIITKLLKNPHQAIVELHPDQQHLKRQEQAIAARLTALDQPNNPNFYQQIKQLNADLAASQQLNENIAVLPKVALSDIKLKKERITSDLISQHQHPQDEQSSLTHYAQATNGLAYIEIRFPLANLSPAEEQLLPVLASLLTDLGTSKRSYDKLAIALDLYTGGVFAGPEIWPIFNGKAEFGSFFTVSSRSLLKNYQPTLDLISEIINHFSFSDSSRVQDLLKQRADSLTDRVLQAGHSFAASLAMSKLHKIAARQELYSGITQVKLAKDTETDNQAAILQLSEDLTKLGQKIFKNSIPEILCITPPDQKNELITQTVDFWQNFSSQPQPLNATSLAENRSLNEMWLLATPVSYVAKAFVAPNLFSAKSPAFMILAPLLRAGFLHQAIREQGGAYGAMAGYDADLGIFTFLSYRDPQLQATLEAYQAAIDWAAAGKFSSSELEAAIIQTFSKLDRPLSARQKAKIDYIQKQQGISADFTDEYRQKLRQLTAKEVASVAASWKEAPAVKTAITSKEILQTQDLPDKYLINEL